MSSFRENGAKNSFLLPLLSLSERADPRERKKWKRGIVIARRRVIALALVGVLVVIWGSSRRFLSSATKENAPSSAKRGFRGRRVPADESGSRKDARGGETTASWTTVGKTTPASSSPSSSSSSSPPDDDATFDADSPSTSSRTLSFQVCNGFANQRLSIAYAAIIAKETRRALCLPRLLLDGTQRDTSKQVTEQTTRATTEFGTFYDVDAFARGMEAVGVRVVRSSRNSDAVVVPASHEPSDLIRSTSSAYDDAEHLSVRCPLFELDKSVVGRHRELVEAALSSLVPSPSQKSTIEKLKSDLSISDGRYNVLHLRVERDWIDHCRTWVSDRGVCLAEEVVRSIGEHLDLKAVPRGATLYVVCDSPLANAGLLDAALENLKAMGYNKVTLQGQDGFGKGGKKRLARSSSFSSSSSPSRHVDREIRAMHAYYLGLHSLKYVGNSVSTFSALLMLERQTRNRWSTYYNMGGIPLMDFIPFFRMPWVFTYNGESPGFDYMAKSAVLSAIHVGRVVPHCIYMGDKSDEMYRWLKKEGVAVILHDPSWKANVVRSYDDAKEFAREAATYESVTSLVATFMRFDVPVVHALYQYNYVLYTDVDVLFLKKIDLHSFPSKLPETIAMANEIDDEFPCNAGVVLYNLPSARRSYHELVSFAMRAPGLHFGKRYGPADQGALNKFYELELGSKCSLPESFNAKPYKLGDVESLDDVFILHFHGPKPEHYLDFANKRGCGPFASEVGRGSFLRLCREGLVNLCELRIEVPKPLRLEGAWDVLNRLQTVACKERFGDLV